MDNASEITLLLNRASAGDREASEELAAAVYTELRTIARGMMGRERLDHTLQPTAVAGQAYINLVDERARNWQNRAHFFSVAARAMRRILVDHSRKTTSVKRGGQWRRVDMNDMVGAETHYDDILAVDAALERLKRVDARQCGIVELRYFGGLSEEETAEALGLSIRTIRREWVVARSWLYAELTKGPADSTASR